jgi:hypothetical protein
MDKYRIIADPSGVYKAEVIHADGRVETGDDFPSKEAALDWVGERIVVRRDPTDRTPDRP